MTEWEASASCDACGRRFTPEVAGQQQCSQRCWKLACRRWEAQRRESTPWSQSPSSYSATPYPATQELEPPPPEPGEQARGETQAGTGQGPSPVEYSPSTHAYYPYPYGPPPNYPPPVQYAPYPYGPQPGYPPPAYYAPYPYSPPPGHAPPPPYSPYSWGPPSAYWPTPYRRDPVIPPALLAWGSSLGLLGLLLTILVGVGVLVFLATMIFLPRGAPDGVLGQFFVLAAAFPSFALVLWLFGRKIGWPAVKRFFSLPYPRTALQLTAVVLLLDWGLSFSGVIIMDHLLPEGLGVEEDEPLFQGDLYLALLLLNTVIIAPILEELIFRGYILQQFLTVYSERTAILCSALVFGLVHLAPVTIVVAFIGGALYAWLRIRTGSLLPSMFCHAAWNGLVVTLAFVV